jgi:hypothetical protein
MRGCRTSGKRARYVHCRLNFARLALTRQDESVVDALGKLIVSEDKRDRLTCTTKGLQYLDKAH